MLNNEQEIWEKFVKESRVNGVLIERVIKSFYRTFLKRDSICIDVGAHVGYHTLGIAEKVTDGMVLACEASPATYLRLLKSIKDSKPEVGKILTINAAIQDEVTKKTVTFNYSEKHPGRSGLQKSWDDLDYIECSITAQTVDSIVLSLGLNRIDFIKIDVEGTEFDVLRGSEFVLNKLRPVVIAEHSRLIIGSFFENWKNFIEKNGYKAFFPNGVSVDANNFNEYWYVFLFPDERTEELLDILSVTLTNYERHVY